MKNAQMSLYRLKDISGVIGTMSKRKTFLHRLQLRGMWWYLVSDFSISLHDSGKSKSFSETERIRIRIFQILASLESHHLELLQVHVLMESYTANLQRGRCFKYSFWVFCFQIEMFPKRDALPISPWDTALQVLGNVSFFSPSPSVPLLTLAALLSLQKDRSSLASFASLKHDRGVSFCF